MRKQYDNYICNIFLLKNNLLKTWYNLLNGSVVCCRQKMSPLNRGPLPGPRMLPAGMRPPLPRFHGVRPPMPGMPPRMPPPPIGGPPAMFGPMRHRMMLPRPPPGMGPMRPGPGVPPLMFGPRGRGIVPPLMPPMMGPKGMRLCGPPMRPRPRLLPPQGLPHMRPRFPIGNGNAKGKPMNSAKKVNKLEVNKIQLHVLI